MKPESSKERGISDDFIVRPKQRIATLTQKQPEPGQATPAVTHEAPKIQIKQLKKRWKRLRLWLLDIWQPLLITLAVTTVVCLMLGFRIGSLTDGLSKPEQQYITSVRSGKELLNHPSFMIHKIPTYTLFKLGAERVAYYRLISATMGALAILSGFYVLRRWYSLRVSLLGSWLMLTSAWLLHTARLATPEASFLLLAPLLWMAVWMYNTERRQYAMSALLVTSVVCFYIPGFMWLVLGAVVWQRKTIFNEFREVRSWFQVAVIFGTLIGLAPLVYGAIQNPSELLLVAGLPQTIPKLSTVAHSLAAIPVHLLAYGPNDPIRWLGRIPLLDVFSAVMLVLGIYSLRYNLKLIRTQLLLFSAMLLIVLIAASGPVTILALLPIIYILIAGGIAFMLQQWFTIFPRNPIARGLGTTLISILVLMVSFYHFNHYFIAWPQTPATKASFGQSLLK